MEHADEDESPPLDTKLTSDNLKQEKVSKEYRRVPKLLVVRQGEAIFKLQH